MQAATALPPCERLQILPVEPAPAPAELGALRGFLAAFIGVSVQLHPCVPVAALRYAKRRNHADGSVQLSAEDVGERTACSGPTTVRTCR